jgi:hypothetical protein
MSRRPAKRAGTVQAFYGPPERNDAPDMVYQWGGGGATKRHALALAYLLGFESRRSEDVAAKFAEYGFDITTLRVSVDVRKEQT